MTDVIVAVLSTAGAVVSVVSEAAFKVVPDVLSEVVSVPKESVFAAGVVAAGVVAVCEYPGGVVELAMS